MKRALRVGLRVLLVLVATGVLFEVAVRALLFAGLEVGGGLRQAQRFANPRRDSLYWELQSAFLPDARRRPPLGYDPRVGWTGKSAAPGTYAHAREGALDDRRLVLLYGDSYSECTTPANDCFQGILERSPLGREYQMLNYGAGGFGLDQTWQLLEASVDRFADRAPIVVVGLLVDDDLDRCRLDFRAWPKPRFHLEGGRLVRTEEVVPTVDERLASLPWRLTSYGLRALVFGTALLDPRTRERLVGAEASDRELRELARAIFAELVAGLERRGREYFFLLFYNEPGLADPARSEWRDAFVRSTLDELGAPWVSTRGALLAHAERTGRPLADYFGDSGKQIGHLNPLGNLVASRALREGLEGRFGESASEGAFTAFELEEPLDPAVIAEVVAPGKRAGARYEYGLRPPFSGPWGESRLCLQPGKKGPVEVHYDLAGRAERFRAHVRLQPRENARRELGLVDVALLADGEVLFQRRFGHDDPPFEVDVELAGRRRLVIRAGDGGDGITGDILVLGDPRFR